MRFRSRSESLQMNVSSLWTALATQNSDSPHVPSFAPSSVKCYEKKSTFFLCLADEIRRVAADLAAVEDVE